MLEHHLEGKSVALFLFILIVFLVFVLLLIPTVFGAIFSFMWFIVTLPFRCLRYLLVDVLGGTLNLAWQIYSGFFEIFGSFGGVVKWLVLAAGAAFAAMFLYHFFTDAGSEGSDGNPKA